MLTLQLDPARDRQLGRLARARRTTKAAFATAAVVERLEEEEDIKIAESRLKQPAARIPLEDIERDLGLAR